MPNSIQANQAENVSFKECAKTESELESELSDCSKKAKKIKPLLKELEEIREKYQKAKESGSQSGMQKYYKKANESFKKVKRLLIEQKEKQENAINKFNSLFGKLNSWDLKTALGIKK